MAHRRTLLEPSLGQQSDSGSGWGQSWLLALGIAGRLDVVVVGCVYQMKSSSEDERLDRCLEIGGRRGEQKKMSKLGIVAAAEYAAVVVACED